MSCSRVGDSGDAVLILHARVINDLHSACDKPAPKALIMGSIDRPAQIPNDGDAQTVLDRILGAPSHAVVARQPADEDLADAVILEVSGEAGRRPFAARIPVVAQRAVGVDLRVSRLADNRGGLIPRKVGMQSRAMGAL